MPEAGDMTPRSVPPRTPPGRNAAHPSPAGASPVPASAPESPGELEPLNGAVCAQYIRCNKPECRCHRGEPHGPYHYRVWREGGRVRKQYIRPEDVERVRAACRAYREMAMRLREMRRQREMLAVQLRQEIKRAKRLIGPSAR